MKNLPEPTLKFGEATIGLLVFRPGALEGAVPFGVGNGRAVGAGGLARHTGDWCG